MDISIIIPTFNCEHVLARTLASVAEAVNGSDELIVNEPNFFDHLSSHGPETYSLDIVARIAASKFANCTVVDSHPASRKLLVLEK